MCNIILDSAVATSQSNPLPLILLLAVVGIVCIIVFIIKKSNKNNKNSDYVLSDMETLNQLYECGNITKEEYDKRKRDLINCL